ncbi:MAG: hypothetical protein OXH04_15960 [Acidobacteria bacterium]|nr:hypothetical protein [Acidobacteriota bacterium]
MRRMVYAAIVAAGLVLAMPAAPDAQEREPVDVSSLGPQVGERIPDFALPDQHGKVQTLESIMGERGAMIVFHRSANW